jgi:catechol 2,3-dioxygenase-like lactoylglutathione lyase family enzyme
MVKVTDIAFVRFAAPDLDRMERFLVDFGLSRVLRDQSDEPEEGALYMRGSGPDPWLHQTVVGEPAFRGVGFEVESAADLEDASRLEGASAIEDLTSPGGGSRVRFVDPDGFDIEVVQGRAPAKPLDVDRALPLNCGLERPRVGLRQSVPGGPARVRRLGHLVLKVKDFQTSSAWYRERFGFIASDEVYLGEKTNVITAFMRCDRGAMPVDHHTFLCVGLGETGFDHIAFEVEDFDAVMAGKAHLEAAGYQHVAGVGRHILGSQIFDYWKDPWGHTVEHFTDGDLFDASVATNLYDPGVALGTHWGPPPAP